MQRFANGADSWPMRFAQANGVRLAYFDEGVGVPLMMIHGWPIHSFGWRRLAGCLVERFRVVALDLRGCGDSEIVASGFDKRTLAADVRALMDYLHLEHVVAVGHDWGVTIAFRLALDFPENVAGLVVSQGRLPLLASHTTLTYMPQQVRERWYANFNMVPDLPEIVIGRSLREYFTYLCARFSGGKLIHTDEDIEELLRVLSRENGLRGGLGLYRTSIGQDIEHWKQHAASTLGVPTLALWAGADPVITQEYLEDLGRFIPELQVCVHGTAGHFLPEEEPAWCAARIADFVARRVHLEKTINPTRAA